MAMMDKTPSKVDFNARYCYFRAFTNMREVGRSLQSLAKQSLEHVANRHRVFKGDLADELRALTRSCAGFRVQSTANRISKNCT